MITVGINAANKPFLSWVKRRVLGNLSEKICRVFTVPLCDVRERAPGADYTERINDAQTTSRFSKIETFKFGKPILEKEFFPSDRPIAVFTDDDVRDAFAF